MSFKPCFIEVTELRAIKSDPNQWMLVKRTKKTDKDTGKPTGGYSTWESYKYFTDFDQAVGYLHGELVRGSGSTTFTELERASKKLRAHLEDLLERAKV